MMPLPNNQTILVADDNGPLRELIEVILCSAGYCVLTALNGVDALRVARQTPQIDLLLSDLEMPGMGGEELATRFSRLHPWTPIIFISSANCPPTADQPFEFIAKPFTVADLRSAVRRALQTFPAFAEASSTP